MTDTPTAPANLHEKLVIIQSTLKAPKGQYNSFAKYHYRNCEDILEALKPLLKEQGLTLHLSDSVEQVGDRIYVKATAWLSDSRMTMQASAYARESAERKGMDESQITGAASSYARKFALNGLFCIDDTKDADTMDNKKTAATPKATQSAPPKAPEPATQAQLEDIVNLARTLDMDVKADIYAKMGIEKPTLPQAKAIIENLRQKIEKKLQEEETDKVSNSDL